MSETVAWYQLAAAGASALFAVVLAGITWWYARLTGDLVQLTRRQFEQSIRPRVHLSPLRYEDSFMVLVTNEGLGTAIGLRIEVDFVVPTAKGDLVPMQRTLHPVLGVGLRSGESVLIDLALGGGSERLAQGRKVSIVAYWSDLVGKADEPTQVSPLTGDFPVFDDEQYRRLLTDYSPRGAGPIGARKTSVAP